HSVTGLPLDAGDLSPRPAGCRSPGYQHRWSVLPTSGGGFHRERDRSTPEKPRIGTRPAVLARRAAAWRARPIERSTRDSAGESSPVRITAARLDQSCWFGHVLHASFGKLSRSLSASGRALRRPSACDRSDRTPRTLEQASRVYLDYLVGRRHRPRAGSAVPARFPRTSRT